MTISTQQAYQIGKNYGDGQHERDGARTILRAVMLHMPTRGSPEACNLPEMWRVVCARDYAA